MWQSENASCLQIIYVKWDFYAKDFIGRANKWEKPTSLP